MTLNELYTKLKRLELLKIKALDGPLPADEQAEKESLEAEVV